MKNFLLALFALQVSGTLFAQNNPDSLSKNTYFGYEIGMGKAKIPSTTNSGLSISNIDSTANNSRFFLGKSFNDYWGVEAGHYVVGKYAGTVDNVQYASSLGLYDISLISRPLPNKRIFFSAGANYGEEISSNNRLTGWGTSAGVGYEMPFYSNALRFSYRKFISPARNSYDISSYNIGLVMPFEEINSNKFQGSSNGNLSVGLMYSFITYSEPEVDMKITGRLKGILFDYDFNKSDPDSLKMETRYSQGLANYSGSGNVYGDVENLLEVRFTKKILLSRLNSIFPEFYSGIGYRKYDDDARGLSTLGYRGYRRTSQYIYIPLGIEKDIYISNKNVTAKLEYDHFISGKQKSYLSDTQLYSFDIENKQTSGYGFRSSLSFNQNGWQIVPFIEYWSIDNSELTAGSWYEPKNSTKEIGLKVFKSF
jgi:hypothetical protein